ncbi:MAG: redoxin family protein [Rhodocyclaceae bacterium]|nr:redoxin family protein [Rhodocyclaceae bacterium]MBX3668106.1 redoxin family protein [Rhodocyclaceae bacterium]
MPAEPLNKPSDIAAKVPCPDAANEPIFDARTHTAKVMPFDSERDFPQRHTERLKAYYVRIYACAVVPLTLFAWLLHAYYFGWSFAWGGVALAGAGMAGTLFAVCVLASYAPSLVRLKPSMPFALAVSAAGVALSVAGIVRDESQAWLALALALINCAGMLLFVFWYAPLRRKISTRLQIGDTMPDMLLRDLRGNVVDTRHFYGRPTVWVFDRGIASPFCAAYVQLVACYYRRMRKSGAHVVVVSGDSIAQMRRLRRHITATIDFLVDPDLAAARALDILHPYGAAGKRDAFYPTLVISDEFGRIRHVEQAELRHTRPGPQIAVDVLRGKHRPA